MLTSKNCKLFFVFFLLVLAACSESSQEAFQEAGLATGEPGMNKFTESLPGESTVMERSYELAPPVIPHSIEDLSIDRSENDCLGCHLEGEEVDEGHVATKIPDSHYLNEFSGKKETESVTGIRYYCSQCHVPQAEVDLTEGSKIETAIYKVQ